MISAINMDHSLKYIYWKTFHMHCANNWMWTPDLPKSQFYFLNTISNGILRLVYTLSYLEKMSILDLMITSS